MSSRAASLIWGRITLCLICWFALTAVFQVANAARGTADNWDRLEDPTIWIFVAISAAIIGFWGFASIMLSLLCKSQLGRVMFVILGLLYMVFIAFAGYEEFNHSSAYELVFDTFIVPLVATIVMVPMMLICAGIAKVAGTADDE